MADWIKLADIVTDVSAQEKLQARAGGLDKMHIVDLVEAMEDGKTLGPIKAVYDGTVYYPYDGWHRVMAHRRRRCTEIQAEVRPGTLQDALLLATGSNQDHGLKRNRADKKRAVELAFAHPESKDWTSARIADHVGVSVRFVTDLRRDREWEKGPDGKEIPREASNGKKWDREASDRKSNPNRPWQWPKWLLAPFIAMDSDGQWYAYGKIPTLGKGFEGWASNEDDVPLSTTLTTFVNPPYTGDWKKSVMKNPYGNRKEKVSA